jgi:hypothetical protein
MARPTGWELSWRDEQILRHKMAAALKSIDKSSFPVVIIPVSFQIITNGPMGDIPAKVCFTDHKSTS